MNSPTNLDQVQAQICQQSTNTVRISIDTVKVQRITSFDQFLAAHPNMRNLRPAIQTGSVLLVKGR